MNGHIVRAAASAKELRLGEIMVSRGLLGEGALEQATQIVVRDRRPLGEVLKELGVIGHDALEDALVLHVCEVLAEVLSWREGSYVFEERQAETFLEETDYPLKMSTGDMILEAVTLVQDRDTIGYALGDLNRVLLPSASARLRFQHMNLAPIDGFVLSRVDGTLTAREVIEVTPLPPEAVERSLLALLCTGIVEDVPVSLEKRAPDSAEQVRQEILDAYEHLAVRNHFEVLGVTFSATDAEVKAAYFRLAKRLHPDVHHRPALADLRAPLDAVFSRLNEAYEALSNPRARAAYQSQLQAGPGEPPATPPPEPPRADDMFGRAKECFDEGRYWEAAALLGETIRFAEGDLRLRARVLLAQAYLRNPASIRDAERELHAAIQEDAACLDAYLLLGVLYQRAGLNARAKTMFEKVLELKPGHRKALAALESLASEP